MPGPDYNFPREKRFLFMFAFCTGLFIFISYVQFYDPHQGEDVAILNGFFALMSVISAALGLWWVRFRISEPVMAELTFAETPMYITNHWIVSLVFFWVIGIFGLVLSVQAVNPLYAWIYCGIALLLMANHLPQLKRIGKVLRLLEERHVESSSAEVPTSADQPAAQAAEEGI